MSDKTWWCLLIAAIVSTILLCPVVAAGLTESSLKNATALAPDMEGDGTHALQFKNGFHKNEYGTDTIMHTAVGDLNGDGINDGAIVFYEQGGGSGAFMRMSVFLCKNGKPVEIGSRTLGDRSSTKSLKISTQVLTLDIMTHGPSDTAGFPTVRKVIKFHVKKGKLVGTENVDW